MRCNRNRVSNRLNYIEQKKKEQRQINYIISQKCISKRKGKGKIPHVAVKCNKGHQLLIITNKSIIQRKFLPSNLYED